MLSMKVTMIWNPIRILSRRIDALLKIGVILFVILLYPSTVIALQDGIFNTFTGTSAFSACTGCHSGSTSGFTGYQIRVYKDSISAANQLFNTSDELSKNVTTSLLAFLSGAGASAGGFNLNTSTGTFSAGIDTKISGTQITHIDVNGTGTNPGGKPASGGDVSWTFDYNVPNTTGTVIFSLCGNPVNGDGAASGADGPSDTGNVPVCSVYTVSIVNDPPVADSIETSSVGENSTVIISDAFLLTGDTDANSDPLTVSGFNETSTTGDVTDNGVSFTYDPNGQFESLDTSESATDTFTYTVSDGSLTATGTVMVTINGANDTPTAVNDGTDVAGYVTVAEGGMVDNETDGVSGNNDLAG
ncbi:MAG: Ig-like domain-containing protein, partial [Gammaproteobacteria bacterium]|nr:Ig-like domain-containing protein [Gammaproteobacteria bacterium]